MRLRFLLVDAWTAFKYRHAFQTAQRRASWETSGAGPRVTAPREQRRQWKSVLRFNANRISARN
jgi:hypothetical protein